jgi:hypothetical protein
MGVKMEVRFLAGSILFALLCWSVAPPVLAWDIGCKTAVDASARSTQEQGYSEAIVGESSRENQWHLKYEIGPQPVKRGTEVVVTVDSEHISYTTGEGEQFFIPVSAVSEVASDTLVSRGSQKVMHWFRDAGEGWALIVPAALIAHAFKSEHRFVQLVWDEGDGQKQVWFQVDQENHTAFLEALELATGRRVVDLAKLRADLLQDLEREKNNKLDIQLDRPVWLNGAKLDSGRYQLIVLERPNDEHALYFFRGKKVKPRQVAAVTPVEILPSTLASSSDKVVYGVDENRPAMITEVQFPHRTLLLPTRFQLLGPQRLDFEEDQPIVWFGRGSNFISEALYIDYDGEPAVRFYVSHDHAWLSCLGHLYVMRDRVAYVPLSELPPPDLKHAFDVPREQLRRIKRQSVAIRLALPHRNYDFIPSLFHLPRSPNLRELEVPEEERYEVRSESLDFLFLTLDHFAAVQEEFEQALASQ